MERLYCNKKNSKVHKLTALSRSVPWISGQRLRSFRHHPPNSLGFDSCCALSNLPAVGAKNPVIGKHYLGGSRTVSPLSAIENMEISPTVFETPVKVEEDMVVVDRIPAGPVSGATARLSSDNFGSKSAGAKSFYKTVICESGSCRSGAKCQMNSPTESTVVAAAFAHIKREHATSNLDSSSIAFVSTDWSPLDDGIQAGLPFADTTVKSPSRELIAAGISGVLYGPTQVKNLPVFAEICRKVNVPFSG